MGRWGLNRGQLVDLFGAARDDWMQADMAGWLAPNRLFQARPLRVRRGAGALSAEAEGEASRVRRAAARGWRLAAGRRG